MAGSIAESLGITTTCERGESGELKGTVCEVPPSPNSPSVHYHSSQYSQSLFILVLSSSPSKLT